MQHCSIACTWKKFVMPHDDYFSAMQQNTFNGAKKMSLGHGSRIELNLSRSRVPGTIYLLHWVFFFSIEQKFIMSHRPPPSATLAPRLFSCAARHKNILTHSLAAHDTHRGENNMFFLHSWKMSESELITAKSMYKSPMAALRRFHVRAMEQCCIACARK